MNVRLKLMLAGGVSTTGSRSVEYGSQSVDYGECPIVEVVFFWLLEPTIAQLEYVLAGVVFQVRGVELSTPT